MQRQIIRSFDPQRAATTLFGATLYAAQTHGKDRPILEDVTRAPLSYGHLLIGALIIGGRLSKDTVRGETVGVMLPNANAFVVTLLGLNAYGRVSALLNFTSGVKNIRAAIALAEIRTVVTSRKFIETAKLDELVRQLAETTGRGGQKLRIVYLEDIQKAVGTLTKVAGAAKAAFAARIHRRYGLKPDEPATILFTSGTEGAPKGVVLSSRNLVSNALQIAAHGGDAFLPGDIVMNPLPMFHSFGLTAATLFPLLQGMKVVLYPSPLQYRQIAAITRDTKATVMFATDTFLQGYGRAADTDDFKSVRVVVCGAERVKDATRNLWQKWGTTLVEGYGATECSPVIACNVPATNTPGTVGGILPGIEHRLEPVEGIAAGGQLMVRGPNVMLGYMRADAPGVIQPPDRGWHDTGDIVELDQNGFIAIKGRAKRFAKIGGEMISLAAVETMIAGLWPEANHIVVSIPDPRKGEQLVLLTDKPDADKSILLARARDDGFPELWVPRAVLVVPQIPVLGSGKVDFVAAAELARQQRPFL